MDFKNNLTGYPLVPQKFWKRPGSVKKSDLADFDEPEISFHDKIVTIVKPNLNICFSLPERT